MSQHTPGPWSIEKGHMVVAPHMPKRVWGDSGEYEGNYIVCQPHLYTQPQGEELEANARLIAAAPDLLAALIECADELEDAFQANYEGMLDYPHNRTKLERDLEPVSRARAAIAKARGEGEMSNVMGR